MAANINQLNQMVRKIQTWPFGRFFLNVALSNKIPFVGTSKIKILEMTSTRLKVEIPNQRAVRNHIGQVHAAAMMCLGETASGLLAGMNVPDTSLPLIKEMKSSFVKRSTGKLTAVCELAPGQESLFITEKGEIRLRVQITDAAGVEPVEIEAIWAWIPKIKKAPEV